MIVKRLGKNKYIYFFDKFIYKVFIFYGLGKEFKDWESMDGWIE